MKKVKKLLLKGVVEKEISKLKVITNFWNRTLRVKSNADKI